MLPEVGKHLVELARGLVADFDHKVHGDWLATVLELAPDFIFAGARETGVEGDVGTEAFPVHLPGVGMEIALCVLAQDHAVSACAQKRFKVCDRDPILGEGKGEISLFASGEW